MWRWRQSLKWCIYRQMPRVASSHQDLTHRHRWNGFFLKISRKKWCLLTPWLCSSGLLNYEIINSCCFRPPNSVVIFYDTSRKLTWQVAEAMGKSVLECLTLALKIQLKVVCLLPTHNSLARTIHTASCKLEEVRKCNLNGTEKQRTRSIWQWH